MANILETFTESERNSLIVEMIMQEGSQMDNVFSLLGFLHKEKERILELLITADNDLRQTLWPQLDEVKKDLVWTEEYIDHKINEN